MPAGTPFVPAAAQRAAVVPLTASRLRAVLAVAAVLALGATAAVEGVAAHAASARLATTDAALVAIAGSHFAHVALAGQAGIVAKALYARDGAWCYVVVRGAARGARVVLRNGDSARDAGPLAGGDPATAFVREPGRVGEIDVVVDGRVVARAAPSY